MQTAAGYRYTVKRGMVTFDDGEHTGELPGSLVRGRAGKRRADRSLVQRSALAGRDDAHCPSAASPSDPANDP